MNEYETKLAVKRVKADATKALNQWRKLKSISISDIIRGMGYYEDSRDMYKFTKRYYAGTEVFTLVLDTYQLIIGNGSKIEAQVL